MPFAERVARYLRFKSYSQRLYRRARARNSMTIVDTMDAFAL
jgi:hypothetical protein